MAAFVARIQLSGGGIDGEVSASLRRALASLRAAGSPGERFRGKLLGDRSVFVLGGESDCRSVGPSRLHVLFDGRLDDRTGLAASLSERASGLSDLALVVLAFQRWGIDVARRLVGPFALVVWDESRREVFAARDLLGDRRLVYRLAEGRLSMTTHERLLLADEAAPPPLDERTAARFFAYRAPVPHDTWYLGIHELAPGHCLTAGEEGVSVWDYRRRRAPRNAMPDDREAIKEFKEILAEAVRCRLRPSESAGPPAVMMSGGLDSTSVAALSAQEVGNRLLPVSWVFDRLGECDERRFSEPVVRALGLELRTVASDLRSPLENAEALSGTPELPGVDLYDALLRAVLREAREAGASYLLTGHHANQLWEGGDLWLRDLLARRHFREAVICLRRTRARRGLAAVARLGGWGGGAERAPEWLTQRARRLAARRPSEMRWRSAQRGWWGPLRPYWTVEAARLRQMGLEEGIEIRMPYRDRRLIELVLELPADLLDRPGARRRLHREAMRGVLPEAVRLREGPTNIYLWAERWLLGRHRDRFFALLGEGEREWSRFVDRDWLWVRLRSTPAPSTVHLAWRCIGFARWAHRTW